MIPGPYQPYFVIFILVVLFTLIYRETFRPSVSFMLAIIIFIVTGILTPLEVLAGFSNDKIASIILLILITAALRKNFDLELLFEYIFGKTKKYKAFLLRMMGQVAIFSSMINNAPVVALMTPYVINWGKNNNIAPSRLLIPLSFATIMGGMLTVIGTSTNLLMNGFLTDYNEPLIQSMDLLRIGLAVSITGILFIFLIGYRLLPDHKDALDQFEKNKREYIVETYLSKDSPLIGKTVKEAGLRNLKGIYLVEILRGDEIISPVSPSEKLHEDDLLFFAGNTENIIELINSQRGILLPKHPKAIEDSTEGVEVVECVISSNSSLIGKEVRESDFRQRYSAAIIAIHRGGERIRGKIGNIELKAGDLVLLYAGKEFTEKADIYRDMFIISTQGKRTNSGSKKYLALGIIGACIITLIIYGRISLFASLLIIFAILIGFSLFTMRELKRELDLNLVGILVFSLGLGKAIIKTNAGNMVAMGVINVLDDYGLLAVLIGLMFITTLITSLIGNVGAVSIAFPLAFSLANNLGISAMPLYLGVVYSASATFLTPISYQTNLIIYGPGGYNFKDFFKVGLPVTILYLTVAILSIIMLYGEVLGL